MRRLEITLEDLQEIKQYLQDRKSLELRPAGRRKFIRHHASRFLLGGSVLYRKTASGSEKVVGPFVLKEHTTFLPVLSKEKIEAENSYTVPVDSPFSDW